MTMMMGTKRGVIWVGAFLFLIWACQHVEGQLNVSWPTPITHVHLIASVKLPNGFTNFLFRGGTPVPNVPDFLYSELIESMQIAAAVEGVYLDANNLFIEDINLENVDMNTTTTFSTDAQRTYSEWLFFNKNPQLGNFRFWHTNGTDSNARLIADRTDPGFFNFLVSTFPAWDSDLLTHRIPTLHQMLHTTYGAHNTAIYGHCDCGCDRTGETFGSYAMTYQGHSWVETNERNKLIAGRPMCCSNYRNMQWYCLYLNFQNPLGSQRDCLDTQPCDNTC